MAKISKDMLISDAIQQGEFEAIRDCLVSYGMHCFGCALAHGETIEEAAMAHGIDVDDMVDALNNICG